MQVMEYVDTKGVRTRRIVSPIRFLPSGRFLGLCLSRCEPRQFNLDPTRVEIDGYQSEVLLSDRIAFTPGQRVWLVRLGSAGDQSTFETTQDYFETHGTLIDQFESTAGRVLLYGMES